MRVLAIAAGFTAGLVTCAVADPTALLAPDDPANGSGWRPPSAVTEGLEPFAPVDARDWVERNRDAAGRDMPGMKDMPGMQDMGGMHDMPAMRGGR